MNLSQKYPVRAEHAFPPTQAVYTPRQKTLPVGSHSSFRLKPSRSSGAPSAPGAFGAGRASRGTALRAVGSLGQAELRKSLSSVGACVFLCSANLWKGAAMVGSRAGTYQVAYQRVGHLISISADTGRQASSMFGTGSEKLRGAIGK